MTTTADLCKILASSLGLEPEVVADHARHLFAGERTAEAAAASQALPEHASALLISLMSGLPPAKARDALALYGALPLDCAHRGIMQPDGQVLYAKLQGDDDPFIESVAAWGEIFAEFLSSLIGWFNEAPEVSFEVSNFILGGGPGTANALIYFAALVEGKPVIGDVKFSFGTDTLPHDGPRARLERQGVIPGAILPILREFFTGATDGPQEVFMSRADWKRLSEGGRS